MTPAKRVLLPLALVISVPVTGLFVLFLWSIPALRRLPKPGRTTVDGVTTLDEAAQACLRSRLHGWDLVAYAQHLTARTFAYSRRNPWDTPARAFERGLGYCQQQALALKRLYDLLDIESRPVMAMTCRFPPAVVHGIAEPGGISGHVWLRVRVDDEERDVCPGNITNRPGVVNFEVVSPVRELRSWMRPFTHLGSVAVNLRRDHEARTRLSAGGSPQTSPPLHLPTVGPIEFVVY